MTDQDKAEIRTIIADMYETKAEVDAAMQHATLKLTRTVNRLRALNNPLLADTIVSVEALVRKYKVIVQ